IHVPLILNPPPAPGEGLVYRDINFILPGELAPRLGGQTLPDFARRTIFEPLGMKDTTFQPAPGLHSRIAPTEPPSKGLPPLRGVVHDTTARFMGGVAGHAGLFSTAVDLARFARMMLVNGSL